MELEPKPMTNTVIIFGVILGFMAFGNHAQICSEAVDLTVVIDNSDDITPANFNQIREFLIHLVDLRNLEISFGQMRVNFLQFSSVFLSSGSYLTSSRRATTSLQDMRYLGGDLRMTSGVLDYYINRPTVNDRVDSQNVLLLVITGPSEDKDKALQTAERVHSLGHNIMVIGVTRLCVDEDEIQRLASSPRLDGQNYFLFDNYAALNSAAAEAVANGLCHRDDPAPANLTAVTNSSTTTAALGICIRPTTTTLKPVDSTTNVPTTKTKEVFDNLQSNPDSDNGLSASQKVVIGVLVPIILLFTAGAVGVFYYFRTKK